jgi:hypothetical protein
VERDVGMEERPHRTRKGAIKRTVATFEAVIL